MRTHSQAPRGVFLPSQAQGSRRERGSGRKRRRIEGEEGSESLFVSPGSDRGRDGRGQ